MTGVVAWLGALGGASVFAAAIWAVLRAIFRLIDATNDNTEAIKQLTVKQDDITKQVTANTVAIARLQVRRRW